MVIKPEDMLLLDCLGQDSDSIVASKLERLSISDWNGVIDQSKWHSVTPLLYHLVRKLGLYEIIPSVAAERLREIYLRSAGRSIRQFYELSIVLNVLNSNSIPVIVLKGAHLAEIVYDNIALRPMYDLDIMVKKADLQRVEEELLKLGYDAHRDNIRKHEGHYHSVFVSSCGGSNVEVHWHIHRPSSLYNIDVNGLWERARPVEFSGESALVLSYEDSLLYQCVHTCKHLFLLAGMLFLNDISKTIIYYRDRMDWDKVIDLSHKWNVSNSVYLALLLAKELLAAEVPEDSLANIRPNGLHPGVLEGAKDYLFVGRSDTPSLSANVAVLRRSGRLSDNINVFMRGLFPSPKDMAQRYSISPGSLKVYYYYLKRLRELLVRNGNDIWKLLRRDPETVKLADRVNDRIALQDWIHQNNIDEEAERLNLIQDKTLRNH